MASDHDIFRLPEPPPPSPEAREAAIARALEHFDRLHGRAPTAARSVRLATSPRRSRVSLGSPRVRYLLAACLALFIAAPVAWLQVAHHQPGDEAVTRTAHEAARERALRPPTRSARTEEQQVATSEPRASDQSGAAPAAPAPPAPSAMAPAGRQSLAAPPAPAARQGDWQACNADDLDRKIGGCTRVIEDQAESVRNHAAAHLQRGIAHARKGEFDRAIADFDETIRLDPSSAAAYFNRSLAYRAKGDPARAEADRAQAIRIDAGYATR